MTFQLKEYQKETVKFGIANPYAIYALEQGLGKTLCAIETALRTNSKGLIVCPAYLKLKWKHEINKFYPNNKVSVFDRPVDFKPTDEDFIIIAYSFLHKSDVLFEWAKMVIVDECHLVKELKAKRTEALHRLVYENSIPRLLLLTGTPIQNRVYEFYSLIALCNYNPRLEESAFLKTFPNYISFANKFSYLKEYKIPTSRGSRTIQQWTGCKNVEELKKWLKGIYIRFEADKVLNLPPYQDIEIPTSYEEDSELLHAFLAFTDGGENFSVLPEVKVKSAMAKVDFTVEYVKNLMDQGLQVVIYSDHVEPAKLLAYKLGNYAAITGAMAVRDRQSQADRFQSGEQRYLVATIGSFSTGIDLYSSANMVFNDLNWVPGVMAQAKARIRRIGQGRKCTYHYILGSVQDSKILEKLNDKADTIKAII